MTMYAIHRKYIFISNLFQDFVDAFEKLMKLELKGQQYQEIIHVLVHCLLKEKQYNPYYSFLAEQLCSINRKYQVNYFVFFFVRSY